MRPGRPERRWVRGDGELPFVTGEYPARPVENGAPGPRQVDDSERLRLCRPREPRPLDDLERPEAQEQDRKHHERGGPDRTDAHVEPGAAEEAVLDRGDGLDEPTSREARGRQTRPLPPKRRGRLAKTAEVQARPSSEPNTGVAPPHDERPFSLSGEA